MVKQTVSSLTTIVPSKSRFLRFRGGRFAFATVTTQTRLGAIVTKHIQWKVSVTLFAALVLAGLETLFYLPCFLSHFCDQIMWAAAINQIVKALAEQTVDCSNRIAAKVEPIEADHLNAKALEDFLTLEIFRREVGAPRGGIDHACRHPLLEMEFKAIVLQHKLMLPAPLPYRPTGFDAWAGPPVRTMFAAI